VHDRVMDTHDAASDVAERAASVLGPESGLLQDLDAAGFVDALRRALTATLTNPQGSAQAVVQLASDLAQIPVVVGAKALGADLAVTPAKVVFRNHLMELLQYEPQTEQVHATPMLASPPWINKYYVMDLAPGRSFIEWAVQHGRTVFAISYINPSADMADTTMD